MTLDLLDTAVGIFSAAVIALTGMWAQRRTSREQAALNRKDWQETFDMQTRHIETLESRIEDMQTQLDRSTETIVRVRRQAERWSERNAQYYEIIQDYRARLARHGEQTPEVNGE